MKNKLENLIGFDDFKSSWKSEQAKKTKRTETGLDILKEGIEEIIPEGLPNDYDDDNYDDDDDDISTISDENIPDSSPKYGLNYEEKIEKINDFLDDDPDDDIVDKIVNELREYLLDAEQEGSIDDDTIDNLDDTHDGDWIAWTKDVLNDSNIPEESLNNIIGMLENTDGVNFHEDEDLDEDVECPDCDGTGQNEEGEECERCEGAGVVDRPYDIPPTNY